MLRKLVNRTYLIIPTLNFNFDPKNISLLSLILYSLPDLQYAGKYRLSCMRILIYRI